MVSYPRNVSFSSLSHVWHHWHSRNIGRNRRILIKKFSIKDFNGDSIKFSPKEMSITRYLVGGTIFGLGWALSGACPGPMVVNIGYGYLSMIVVFFFAIVGTYLYGVFKDRLPH